MLGRPEKKEDNIQSEVDVVTLNGFECPISGEIMQDPVIAGDGHSYERAEIQKWFDRRNNTSPLTGAELPHLNLIPNINLKQAIQDFNGKKVLLQNYAAIQKAAQEEAKQVQQKLEVAQQDEQRLRQALIEKQNQLDEFKNESQQREDLQKNLLLVTQQQKEEMEKALKESQQREQVLIKALKKEQRRLAQSMQENLSLAIQLQKNKLATTKDLDARGRSYSIVAKADEKASMLNVSSVETTSSSLYPQNQSEQKDSLEKSTKHKAGLKQNLSEATTLFCRSLVLADLGRLEEALEVMGKFLKAVVASFDESLAVQPNSAAKLFSRGVVLVGLGRWGEAVESIGKSLETVLSNLDKLLRGQPNSVSLLLSRGIMLVSLGRLNEALADIDKFLQAVLTELRQQPSDAATFFGRGVVLMGLGRKSEALENFNESLTIQPDDAVTLFIRNMTLMSLDRWEEALSSFKPLIIQPNSTAEIFVRRFIKNLNPFAAISIKESANTLDLKESLPRSLSRSNLQPADVKGEVLTSLLTSPLLSGNGNAAVKEAKHSSTITPESTNSSVSETPSNASALSATSLNNIGRPTNRGLGRYRLGWRDNCCSFFKKHPEITAALGGVTGIAIGAAYQYATKYISECRLI